MTSKSILSFLALFLFYANCISAKIDADMDLATYYQDETPYVEVSFHIVGSSLTQKKLENSYVESRVNVLVKILQGDQIIDFKKYGLVSPKAVLASDFIDLRRFVLNPGQYSIVVELIDQLDNENRLEITKEIEVKKWSTEPFMSEVQLLHRVTKSEQLENPFFKYGNIFEPTAYNFFHKGMDKLILFTELYSLDATHHKALAAKLSITNLDRSDLEPLTKFKKLELAPKNVLIESFAISKMISGNYELKIEVLSPTNDVILATTEIFQRSNPEYDSELLVDSELDLNETFVGRLTSEDLIYNLKALAPRLPQSEVSLMNLLLKENNIEGQKFYLFNYWNIYNPVNPEESFEQYRKIAKAVDVKFYSTVGRGFETDRGYIFLRYGKPKDVISVENEPSAPPYEIWFYDQLDITGETNMKFLFYNPSLGGNDYQLLHSTSRYEKQNRQWEIELYADAPNEIDGNRVDATTVVDNVNRRAREYFEDNN